MSQRLSKLVSSLGWVSNNARKAGRPDLSDDDDEIKSLPRVSGKGITVVSHSKYVLGNSQGRF